MTLPDGARRLFAHFPSDRLDLASHESEIIERLLEDGDGSDLRWLTATISEARLASWFRERAPRRLSNRSRAFWSLVLGLPAEARPGAGDKLWPL